MAGHTPRPANLWQTASVVNQKRPNPWKPIAIALALLLAAVLVAIALVATDVMKLGFSLL